MKTNSIEEAIQDYKEGKFVVIVDDEDRENEGDITISADFITPEKINFMAVNARGLICVAIEGSFLYHLNIPLMVTESNDNNQTAFTVSVDYIPGTTTGISSEDRANTVLGLINSKSDGSSFQKPGHIFPIKYRDGGVLVRAGHTEAAIDIARLADLNPSAVICEIMKDDGTMARLDDLIPFCKKHELKIGSIADLIRYRVNNDPIIRRKNENILNTRETGKWNIYSYENKVVSDSQEYLALTKGNVKSDHPVLVRVHVSNLVSDSFDGFIGEKDNVGYISLRQSMHEINKYGAGLIVIINHKDSDEVLSKYISGKKTWNDEDKIREHGIGAQIIRDIGIREMILLSRTKRAVVGLEGFDLKIIEQKSPSKVKNE